MKYELNKIYLHKDGYNIELLSKEYKSIFGNYFYASRIYRSELGNKSIGFGKIRKRNIIETN